MAIVQPVADTVTVHFTRVEKFFGLLRDLEIPRTAVTAVESVADPVHALRGMRAPGLGLPGIRNIGTWRGRGRKELVCVRRDQPAVRISLQGQRYDSLLIGTDDAAALVVTLAGSR